MSVLMADSCCMTENHKILESNYPSIKKKKPSFTPANSWFT